jgi:hypothetical protein
VLKRVRKEGKKLIICRLDVGLDKGKFDEGTSMMIEAVVIRSTVNDNSLDDFKCCVLFTGN